MTFCSCCCRNKSNKWRMACVEITSAILIAFGAALYSIYWAAYVAVIKDALNVSNKIFWVDSKSEQTIHTVQSDLREGSLLYPQWVEPNQIVDVGFFMMNITNAEDFISQTPDKFVRPVLQRTGPYVYRVTIKKDRLAPVIDSTPKEIAYRQTFNFFYRPELTVGSADDMITTINFFALALGPMLDYLFSLPEATNIPEARKRAAYLAANAAIARTNSSLTLQYSAGEILFGMKDPLYQALAEIVNNALNDTSLALSLPDEFGFFRVLNNSFGWHDYQAYTGDPEYWLTNLISELDHQKVLPYWYGDTCNMINGSDGTIRPPFGSREELVYHLYPSACRSTYVKYVRDTTLKGIPVWEYKPPPEMFQAPDKSSYNKCFCKENSSEPYCKHDGGLYMGPCAYGAPLYISAPHFLHGDGHFLSLLEGMDDPDESIHSTEYSYEPSIGAALSAKKKLQFNLYVTPHSDISTAQIIGTTFVFPMFWLNGTYVVSDRDANLLYGLIVVVRIVVICLQVILIGIGVALTTSLLYYHFSRSRSSSDISIDEMKESGEFDKVETPKGSKRKTSIYGHTNGSFIRKT